MHTVQQQTTEHTTVGTTHRVGRGITRAVHAGLMACVLMLGLSGINAAAMAAVTTSNSAVNSKVIPNQPPAISLTSPATNTLIAAQGNITLTAIAKSKTSTIRSVTFYANNKRLKALIAAPYTYTWNNIPVGIYNLTARAIDKRNVATTSAAVSLKVVKGKIPTINLTRPAANTTATAPGSITLTATATSTTGTIAKVEFYNGTALIGRVTKTPYTYAWNNVPAGNYKLTARVTDNVGLTAATVPISLTVKPGTIQQPVTTQVYYIHTDHLDTPRQVTDSSGAVVWQWDNQDPFGNNLPNENPAGQGRFENPLRFAGQYFDRETNLNYNINRDYDPAVGRYVQSDPIGLQGGINTYTYVGGNPLNWVDPFGLSGTLTINSNGSGDGSLGSGGLSGHSWIEYASDGGGSVTFGTWGNNPNNLGNGLQTNLEQGRTGDASRSTHLDDKQESNLMDLINNYKKRGTDGWAYSSPCSTFASEAWKAGTGESLNPYGPYSNPSTLKNSIINANGGVNHR